MKNSLRQHSILPAILTFDLVLYVSIFGSEWSITTLLEWLYILVQLIQDRWN